MARDTSLYQVDGVRVPSVTEILKLAGLVSFDGVSPGALEVARLRGSAADEWITGICVGDIDPDIDQPAADIKPYVEAFLRFRRESGFVVESAQVTLKNIKYRYAGTLDVTGRMTKLRYPDALYVIDWKCTAALSPATKLQTQGYGECMDTPHRRGCVRLLPDATYRFTGFDDPSDAYDWHAALRIAHFKLRNKLATLED